MEGQVVAAVAPRAQAETDFLSRAGRSRRDVAGPLMAGDSSWSGTAETRPAFQTDQSSGRSLLTKISARASTECDRVNRWRCHSKRRGCLALLPLFRPEGSRRQLPNGPCEHKL